MKKLLLLLVIFASSNVNAVVHCTGKIKSIYKWDTFDTVSVQLDVPEQGLTKWISLPTKSDESMALLAFSSKKDVTFYWSEEAITECVNGWSHNKKFVGYFIVH